MPDIVHLEFADGVGVITLDRPPVNAFSTELITALDAAIGEVDTQRVRAVVVTGDPHFAAGADIKAFKAGMDSGERPGRLGHDLSRVLTRLEGLPKPVIAAVKGFAIGGGLELAVACDFRFFAEDARCGQGEVGLGIIPGAGGTQRLPRLIGLGAARELVYSGRQVAADEALRLGIADEVHPPGDVLDAAMEAAARYAAGPTRAIGIAKRLMNEGLGLPLAAALDLESEGFAEVFSTDDAREGVTAFLEKRPPDFSGR